MITAEIAAGRRTKPRRVEPAAIVARRSRHRQPPADVTGQAGVASFNVDRRDASRPNDGGVCRSRVARSKEVR
jgi:hypothetical protein